MGDRQWMYNRWASAGRMTQEWIKMLKLFLIKHLARLKGLKIVKPHGAPAAAVETHVVLQRWRWHHISIGMDLRETIQS
jgi:hypothetical protein